MQIASFSMIRNQLIRSNKLTRVRAVIRLRNQKCVVLRIRTCTCSTGYCDSTKMSLHRYNTLQRKDSGVVS